MAVSGSVHDVSLLDVREVPWIVGKFNILVQKIQPLLLKNLPAPHRRFAGRRGDDTQFFRLIPLTRYGVAFQGRLYRLFEIFQPASNSSNFVNRKTEERPINHIADEDIF